MKNTFFIFFLVLFFSLRAGNKSGPVVAYSFNNGNTLADVGVSEMRAVGVSLVRDRFSNPTSAVYLHGNYGSYLSLGTSNLIKPKQGTISLWLFIDNPMLKGEGLEDNPIILTKSQPGDDFYEGYYMNYDYNLKKFGATTTQSKLMQVTLRTSDTVALRRWYHLAITYNNDFLCFYVNGSLEAKMKKGFESTFLENDSVMIGNSANTKNKRFFNGSIDDIQIYDRVLGPEEIRELYEAPNPKAYKGKLKIVFFGLIILSGTGLIIFMVSLYFKRQYKKEIEGVKLQNKMSAMEVKVIKAQMNPHFIFNSLNSIQDLILSNENDKAQIYLSKFSRLLRKILESNTTENIILSDEIDLINKYLEIEKLRFNNAFKYEVSFDSDIDPETVLIPNFLVQPFIENAIWHGLLPKEGEKRLSISFKRMNDKGLLCTVEDNGVGITAPKIDIDKKSLAITFIKQRLELLSRIHGSDYGIEMIEKKWLDSKENGIKVIIKLPIVN
jgi:two-component sensor histidine kinase